MSIDQHVNVTLRINSQGVARVGFGIIGHLSYNATPFGDAMSLTYTRLADAITDGFASDGPEALAITRAFQQSPRPRSIKLLKGVNIPTLKYHLTVLSAIEDVPYQIVVKGEGVVAETVEVTPEMGDDEADVAGDLITALNLVEDKNFTAVVDPSDPDSIYVTGDNPGDWFSLAIPKTSRIATAVVHVDPGIADDLADIAIADDNYYYLSTAFNSEDMVLAAAEYIEAQSFKTYIVDFVDSLSENSAMETDLLGQITALGYRRTLPCYHRKPNELMGIALEGRIAPLNPGSWTAAYKTLVGVTADEFSGTQIANLDAKKGTYYKTEAERNITWEGKVGNTDYLFFDNTVALDFVLDGIQKVAFAVKVSLDKVAYTDEDIEMIRSAIAGFIKLCSSDKYKIVAKGTPGDPEDPEPSVTFPKVKDIDPSARALRQLPDGDVSFRLQGAVHTSDITVNVSF